MNNLTVQEVNFDTALADIATTQKMCSELMKTKHYAQMGEVGLFAILQKAKALGVHPLDALNGGLYIVNGKVGMSAEMMASLIRQAGHSIIKDAKSDNSVCILHGKRKDNGDTWTVSFSMMDAQKAGIAKNMYDKYPAAMLYNRALSFLARQLYPDVIKGAGYTHEELVEIKESKESKWQTPAPQVTHQEPAEVERITFDQADELVEILDGCPEDYKTNVLGYIKRPPYNCQSLYELPVSLYDKMKAGAIKKKAESNVKPLYTEEAEKTEE